MVLLCGKIPATLCPSHVGRGKEWASDEGLPCTAHGGGTRTGAMITFKCCSKCEGHHNVQQTVWPYAPRAGGGGSNSVQFRTPNPHDVGRGSKCCAGLRDIPVFGGF